MSAVYNKFILWLSVGFIPALGSVTGCARNVANPSGNSQIIIDTEPANQTVPLGQAATFTVIVSGPPPLSYQWSEDGVVIAGATAASYTTPALTTADSGSQFQVAVSNGTNTVLSTAAILTAGPRSPKAGDLRFQQVDAASVSNMGSGNTGSFDLVTGGSQWYPNSVGSPLMIGPDACNPGVYSCAWLYLYNPLPPDITGLTAHYQSIDYQGFAMEMGPILSNPNDVLTSLDFEPGSFAYAAGWVQSAGGGGFSCKQEVVGSSQIQTTAIDDGLQSRVVTAVTFDEQGNADLFSYGWQGDSATTYEVHAVNSDAQGVLAVAKSLADGGFIITAFGGDRTYGYELIGTKVKGDTQPRSIIAVSQSSPALPGELAGYAPVLWIEDSTSSPSINLRIYER